MPLAYFLAGWILGVISALAVVKIVLVYANRIAKAEQTKRDAKNIVSRARYADNPQVPLRSKARSLVRGALNKEKEFRSEYGYSIANLIISLENRFDPSMTFDNFGVVWEIDHVEPLTAFDLTDKLQFKRAINPTNLQPLFRGENQSKGCK